MFIWIVLAVGLVIASVILHREIYHYDGAHLGPRVQGWLYSIWAAKYDRDKHATQAGDAELLIRPLMERLTGNQISTAEALALDVATGTGRFPLALLQEAGFAGRIIGLDIAGGMLECAAQKLAPYG